MVDSITGLLLYRNLPRRRDGGYRRYHRYTGTRKCADMIVVEKNPLEDLRVLRNVDMVIVQGKVIRAPKVKKKQIVETELDKFLN